MSYARYVHWCQVREKVYTSYNTWLDVVLWTASEEA